MHATCEVRDPAHAALLGAWSAYLGRIAMQGGPEPADYGPLSDWFRQAARGLREQLVTRADVGELLTRIGRAFSTTDTLQGLALAQPSGYAGDFELIDRIYAGTVCSDSALANWDIYFHAQPAIRALRQAKCTFASWLARAEEVRAVPASHLRLLHLGGGPGRELLDYFLENSASRVFCTYLDADARAISHAQKVCAPVSGRVKFQKANPLGFQSAGKPHLVWACGLFDYLDDQNVLNVMRRLWHLLAPGGHLVAGNFSSSNPSLAFMDILGWRLRPRYAAELERLALQAGIPAPAIQVTSGSEGVYLFLHLRKRGSPSF